MDDLGRHVASTTISPFENEPKVKYLEVFAPNNIILFNHWDSIIGFAILHSDELNCSFVQYSNLHCPDFKIGLLVGQFISSDLNICRIKENKNILIKKMQFFVYFDN